MLLTFGEVKASSAVNIAGVSPNSPDFRRLVNESVRRLMKRGDWSGTIVPIYVCVTGQCVVWPRYVGQVRQINYCHNQHVPIKNVWWDFLPYDRSLAWNSNDWWGWLGGGASMVNQARSPVFQDIQGDGRTIRVYPESAADKNKKVTLFGVDNNDQPLMNRGVGPWTSGLQLSIDVPYGETAINIRRIDRVVKDETNGPVRLYAWNSSAGVLEDVAYYEPSEVGPSYVRSRLSLPCGTGSSCGGSGSSNKGVVALVKLQYVPVKADTDLVVIDNLTAIKHMIQCVRCEEAQDVQTSREFLAMAIDELNQELSDDNPETQIPVSFGELGQNQHSLGKQRVF